MIDNDYYVDNTDEVFAAASSGTATQGLKTLLKHFISGFFVIIFTMGFLLSIFFTICVVTYDQDKAALEYFETTDTSIVNVEYSNGDNFYEGEAELLRRMGNRNYVRIYRDTYMSYRRSNIWDYDNAWDVYNYRIECTRAVNVNEFNIESMGYRLISGRLPNNRNEVAITKYTFDVYKMFGYNNGNKVEINEIEDIIGRQVYGRTIVGIVDTNMYIDLKDVRSMNVYERDKYMIALGCETSFGVNNSLFVCFSQFDEYYPTGWVVLLNHDESDMVFYEMYNEYYNNRGHFYAENKDSHLWMSYETDAIFPVMIPIILGCLVLANLFSAILAAGSYRDKKKQMQKMKYKEYETRDFMEMFIPELIIMFLLIIIFSIIGGFVGAKFAMDYTLFGIKFFEAGFALGLLADIGALVLLFVSAFFSIRHKIQRKIGKQIIDRHY